MEIEILIFCFLPGTARGGAGRAGRPAKKKRLRLRLFSYDVRVIPESLSFLLSCSLRRYQTRGDDKCQQILEVYNACGLTTDHKTTTVILCRASSLNIAASVVRFCLTNLHCQYHADLVNVRVPAEAYKRGTPAEILQRWHSQFVNFPWATPFQRSDIVVII